MQNGPEHILIILKEALQAFYLNNYAVILSEQGSLTLFPEK